MINKDKDRQTCFYKVLFPSSASQACCTCKKTERVTPYVWLTPWFSEGGILSLFNITKDTSGFYICTSSNKIRSATCNFTLSVMPRKMDLTSSSHLLTHVSSELIFSYLFISFYNLYTASPHTISNYLLYFISCLIIILTPSHILYLIS